MNINIQEGQYNPAAHNRRNRAAHEQVISKIMKVSADHPNVFFIPKSELYELTSEDFVDYAHVTPEAGLQYSKHLVSYLPF